MYIYLIINQLNKMKTKSNLVNIFEDMEDYRSHINKRHNLTDILVIGVISVICGAETWKQMSAFARSKELFLSSFLELPNGIPSKDTIRRVFSSIDNLQFEECFFNWVSSLSGILKEQVISLDGKTLRGAKSHGKKSPVHMVSAWACENNLVLGQLRVNEKSNEITAIPKLLERLFIENCFITIDAMGCQKEIADKIIKKQADYILAVKENQPELYQDIQDEFRFSKVCDTTTSHDVDHGRIETRTCSVISSFSHIQNAEKWKNLSSIIKIDSIREFKNSDKKSEHSTRYYISSSIKDATFFQKAIRSHWSIENKLHWVLDVAFSEDASRKRKDNAAQNYSILLKIALNLLRNEQTEKQGVKGKRLKAAWDEEYLLKVLNLKV